MPDTPVVNRAVATAPKDYLVPSSQEFILRTVIATIDGTGAAGAFLPALQMISPAGDVMWTAASANSVAAGGSVTASWFPGLTPSIPSGKVAVVGARIENHAGQAVSSSTDTDLTYDTVAFDTGSMANLAGNNRILTANTAGLYLVTCERSWPYNSAGRRLTGVLKNQYIASGGTYVADDSRPAVWAGNIGAGGQTTNGVATLVKCAAGDFIASGCNQDSGSTLTFAGGPGDYLTAILLGTV